MAKSVPIVRQAEAFDPVALGYDAAFAHRSIGRSLRQAVWRHLAPYVRPGMRALDLGCGTGEDAVWLAGAGCSVTAADSSPIMLQATTRKAVQVGVADRIIPLRCDLNASCDLGGPFDLVLSDFGALNCATDLRPLAASLRAAVAPGGVVAAVVMGRFCAWETLWYGARLRSTATRRWRGRTVAKIGGTLIPIRYWRPGDLARVLGAGFRTLSVHPVGLFLPPSDLFALIERRPRLLAQLTRWEARAASCAVLAPLADHHLTILRHDLEGSRP